MDEALKQQLYGALIGFNLTFIAFMLCTQLGIFSTGMGTMLDLVIAFVLGAVIGGIAFGVMKVLQR